MITKVISENKIQHVGYESLLLKLRSQATSLSLDLLPPKEAEEATIPVHLEVCLHPQSIGLLCCDLTTAW